MNKNKIFLLSVFISLGVIFFTRSVPVFATDINSCADITTSNDVYHLTANILNDPSTDCIYISANNITFDCQGHTIDGVNTASTTGIHVIGSNDLIENCVLTNWAWATHGWFGGYNNMTNLSVHDNTHGIYFTESDYNNVANSSVYYNSGWGITFDTSSFINVTNSTVYNNSYGIYAYESGGDWVHNNTIFNNSAFGVIIYATSSVINNMYDNKFNNSINVQLSGVPSDITTYWNTTKAIGTNTINGPNIGGNFWATPSGTGFSETCTDSRVAGYCDSAYDVSDNSSCTPGVDCTIKNTDYLPIVKVSTGCTPPALGHWLINQVCTLSSAVYSVPANLFIAYGGYLKLTSNANLSFTGTGQVIVISPGSGMNISTGSKIYG